MHGDAMQRVLDVLAVHGTPANRQGRAPCPAHGGADPNLAIAQGRSGVLLTCHSHGCKAPDIAQALGLTPADLFDDPRAVTKDGTPRDTVATFEYTDEQGAPLFRVNRMEWYAEGERKKSFPQERYDAASSRYVGGPGCMAGVRRTLYRLPEVVEAVQVGRVVFVTEGEKAADTLRESCGVVATTSPEGAGKWINKNADPTYAETLRGARVVLLPDNDEQGESHMRTAAAALLDVGAEVRMVRLPGLPPKGDAVEWLGAGGTRDELQELVKAAPVLTREALANVDSDVASNTEAAVSESLPPATRALDAPPCEPPEWIIGDVWPAGEVGLIVGDGGAFKSSAALHIAGAIAGGYQVFERFSTVRRPVLIVSAEDSASVILMRLEAFIAGHSWDRERVLGNVHFFAQSDVSLGDVRWRAHLAAECKRLDVGFLVLDPWAELLQGDENSNTDQRPLVKFLRSLANQTKAAVGVVHHAGKAGPDKRTLDRIRGATALPSASRVILFFEFKPDGIAVENIKNSRAPKLAPFVIERDIESDPANRAMWTSARLSFEDAHQRDRERAENFILAQLRAAHPKRLNSTAIRNLAKDVPGLRNEDVASAQSRLAARGLIEWEEGKRGAKEWGLSRFAQSVSPAGDRPNGASEPAPNDLAQAILGKVGKVEDAPCPPCPEPARAGSRAPADPAHPVGVGRGSGGVSPDPAAPKRLGPGTLSPEEILAGIARENAARRDRAEVSDAA